MREGEWGANPQGEHLTVHEVPHSSFARLPGYVRHMDESEFFTVTVRDMQHIQVGDRVLRKFPGLQDFESGVAVELVVSEVDDELIYCGPKGAGWSFDRATGMEVDHDLRWGPTYGVTGTFLVGLAEERPPEAEVSR